MKDERVTRDTEPLTPEQDAELRSKIEHAFDEVKLSDASRASMMSALKQAQEEAKPEMPRKKGRSTARILRFGLPAAAACLVFLLVVAVVNMPSSMTGAPSPNRQETQSSTVAAQKQGASDASSTMNMAQESAHESESAALPAVPGLWFPVVELADGTRLSVTHDIVDAPSKGQPEEALAINEDASKNAPCKVVRIDGGRYAVSFDNETWFMATLAVKS